MSRTGPWGPAGYLVRPSAQQRQRAARKCVRAVECSLFRYASGRKRPLRTVGDQYARERALVLALALRESRRHAGSERLERLHRACEGIEAARRLLLELLDDLQRRYGLDDELEAAGPRILERARVELELVLADATRSEGASWPGK